MTLEALLNSTGPLDITLWIKDSSAQANVRSPGSDGWSCHTRPTAAEALRAALENRLQFAPRPGDDEIDDLI